MGNNINGAGLDALIASLPSVTEGTIIFLDTSNENEQNVMTKSQAAAARAKNWVPYALYYIDEHSNEIREYYGIDDTNVKSINATSNSDGLGKIQYYDLKGIRSAQKNKGISIIRHDDGSVHKIVQK